MHVIIENTVALNTGDAAILVAIIDIVRETFGPDTRISVFDSAPEVAARHYPELQFHPLTTSFLSGTVRLFGRTWKTPLRRLLARAQQWAFRRAIASSLTGSEVRPSLLLSQGALDSLSLYRSADLVISTGGTYLVEHYKLRNRFEELYKDLLLGKPLVLFTQSLGPFRRAENRKDMKAVAEGARLVLLRDAKSKQHLHDIGVDHDRLKVVSDSVFALARAAWITAPPARAAGQRLRVAVSVRRWTHYEGRDRSKGTETYEAAVAAAVSALVRDKNAEIVFLSTCQGIPDYLYDDSQIADRICARLDPDVRRAVSVDHGFHSPTALMETLRDFDFAISTRMHMAILGLCAGLPVLPIAYEFKTTELYRALGQSEWVTDISAIDSEAFATLAVRFSEHFSSFRQIVAPLVLEQAASARSAGRLIAERLSATMDIAPS
ncbi:polysaccharide pyruvyl transferase [Solimonas sp. K1W22B-7]|uniref:polysaccharide pyruvyl transferase family protein n=1 Tax=Solimonas sp. K1W22B-7 TaxID=2303331 RepID=UPI000E333A29|nr:polysaccharide pyruvyl transferase family protein [Solimonas sp. K1W22B-7]AXQ28866.1 polysaccharide pyruvyl transferase [Solimonas sp. K1W22B-7]